MNSKITKMIAVGILAFGLLGVYSLNTDKSVSDKANTLGRKGNTIHENVLLFADPEGDKPLYSAEKIKEIFDKTLIDDVYFRPWKMVR